MKVIIALLVLSIVLFVLYATAANGKLKNAKSEIYPFKKKKLLTEAEKKFYKMLKEAFPEQIIFAQVAMGAIIDVDYSKTKDKSLRNKFNQKIIDFVIMNHLFEVVALVELDDSTHNKEQDEKRDLITSSAGYKTYRFVFKDSSIEKIRNKINI